MRYSLKPVMTYLTNAIELFPLKEFQSVCFSCRFFDGK